jgi:hypothetical protein
MRVGRELELQSIPAVKMIFASRAALLRAKSESAPRGPLVDWLPSSGWSGLRQDGSCVMFGTATKPRKGNVTFRPVACEDFVAFDEPGCVKIAWTIRVEERGAGALCITETRVVTTSVDARRKFRRYWAVFSL